MNGKPRVAIFASVSTPKQAQNDKDSLPSQLRDGRLWADSIGGEVVATFEVPGYSRNYIFYQDIERELPVYTRFREACEAGAFDVLWCRACDHLGRTDALIAQVEALVANAGAQIYSATMPTALESASEASALFLSAIERASAQVENVVRERRRVVGTRARIRQGLPASRWPYGYKAIRNAQGRAIGGEFVPEIEAVRIATQLYLEGVGVDNIARTLNETPYKPRRVRQGPAV